MIFESDQNTYLLACSVGETSSSILDVVVTNIKQDFKVW